MKLFLLPFFVIIISSFPVFGKVQVAENCSIIDSIFIPKNYANGWILDSKGKKEVLNLKFDVKGQRIIFNKNGQLLTYSIGIEKFGVLTENNEERVFERIINKSLNLYSGYFFENIAESKAFKLIAFHKVVESEDAPFIDVKTKVLKLEQVYFLSENGEYKIVKLTKKSLLDYFGKYEVELKDYFKKSKIDFSSSKDLILLFGFVESLQK